MMSNEDPCAAHVTAASVAESAAMELDRAGKVKEAIAKYQDCDRELDEAIKVALPTHSEDRPKLIKHQQEVQERIRHLQAAASSGKTPTIPVEQQIQAVQLGMQAHQAGTAAVSSAGGVKTLGACAVVGAGAGFIVLGSTVGASLAIVGGAAGAAYCATRGDKVGDVARGAGDAALAGVDKARDLDNKHNLTGKAMDAGSKAVTAVKEADQKYGITQRLSMGAHAAAQKVSQIEEKHHVTDKVASGLAAGFGKISSAFEKKR
eukprot:CAMPEP_0206429404 /NCGR_PEP_ID=MMETSP0324_2-20121206/6220_1 /ASSEMBLY_ACC=CAM_ASM_000836 /TAXON_ID=2866 /ORGANISM="Crypthecodinium cohnii, Strain Seligo" /LENGTH=261 /DNA_ID=CAMNT_0053895077 /DNA_START=70 /DNA_END=855 /DNA_ORIENTATION=-